MKMIGITIAMLFCYVVTPTANSQETIFFKSVTPCDVLEGVGLYVKEVGHKAFRGAKDVVKGAGKIISAPFKSRLHWPNPRTFRLDRGYFVHPRLRVLPREPNGILTYPLDEGLHDPYFVNVISFSL